MYNNCSKGPGGPPKLIWTDQTTFELWRAAYYHKYQTQAQENANYPFENFKFNKATVTWDEKIPDVQNGTLTPETGKGTAYFIHPKFMRVKYDVESNFVLSPFQEAPRQKAKIAHMLWMGATTMSNRRKHGVVGNIPRTLTF